MKSVICTFVLGIAMLSTATAGTQNDVPSCYAANNVGRSAPVMDRELFVLIDQTTVLNERLKASARDNVAQFVGPGTSFVVASFSAFSQGRYMEVIAAGAQETAVPEKDRDSIGVKILRNFDACIQGQAKFVQRLHQDAIGKAFDGISNDLGKSDVLASFKSLSERVKESSARDKVVFIISDMLENSSISSFYAGKNVRNIDPAKELKAAHAAKTIGDFGGARVFVLGAGTVAEDPKLATGVYRDPKIMNSLRDFWDQYFQLSNAKLAGFGTPALLNNIK
jgi:hypothetical protein